MYLVDSKLYGADLVVLHSFNSYSSIKWQSEWLSREMDGTQYNLDVNATVPVLALNKKQSGLYSQLIYTHNQNWKMGLRYDTIYQNDIEKSAGDDSFAPTDLNKYSGMVEYHTSEFARFRLQYNHNDAMYGEEDDNGVQHKQSVDTIMLQANIAIGAHSAHSF